MINSAVGTMVEYLVPHALFSYQSLHNWLKFIMRQRLNLSKGYVLFCLKHTKVKSLEDPAMLKVVSSALFVNFTEISVVHFITEISVRLTTEISVKLTSKADETN